MEKLLQEILDLLRKNNCDPKAKTLLSNLNETLTIALSGNADPVQQLQVKSLSDFPTTITELIEQIRQAITDSICPANVKLELQRLMDRFVELHDEYRIENP